MANRYYVEGNAVREIVEPQPARRSREELERIRKQKNRRNAARRNRERTLIMNRGYVLFLTICVSLSAAAAVSIIRTQSSVSTHVRNISALESKVADLKLDNDAKYKQLTTSINLNEIKEKAITELGMKYPTEDQVVFYTVESDNYMDQYRVIPE